MKAAFTGTFDPPTLGHMDLIQRACSLFDEVLVLVCSNSAKKERWSGALRKRWIQQACSEAGLEGVQVEICTGVAALEAKRLGADVLLRGIRNGTDCEYEANMAWMNEQIGKGMPTLCLFCDPALAFISSSNVRELLACHLSIQDMVPACVRADLEQTLA